MMTEFARGSNFPTISFGFFFYIPQVGYEGPSLSIRLLH